MSQGNAENARRTIDAWNRRDLEAMLRIAAPEIVYVNAPAAVEPGTRRGRDEYEAVLRAQWDILGDARLEIESLQATGDDAFAMVRMSRTLAGSPAPLEVLIGMRMTFRDDRLVRQELIPDEDFPRALEAMGLPAPQ